MRTQRWRPTTAPATAAAGRSVSETAWRYAWWAIVLTVVGTGARLLVEARPSVGGVDFYYYLQFARDLANGSPDVPQERYVYFPGVYVFWQSVFWLSGGSLAAIQWAYLAVLFANGILTGVILGVLTGSGHAGALAAGVYFLVSTRIEGLAGITEPIATLPFLLGLGLFTLLRERRAVPYDLLALAGGFGLALFSKQQGGLLSIGAMGLLPSVWSASPPERYTAWQWLLLPLGGAAVFLAAMALEGGGIEAVARGLRTIGEYGAQGSWRGHLVRVFEVTQPLSNLFLSACVVWLGLSAMRDRGTIASETALLVMGICICSVLGGMIQFSKRGYLHYALLMLPSAIIAAGLAVFFVAGSLRQQAARWPGAPARIVALGTVVFLWANSWGATSLAQDAVARLAAAPGWTAQESLAARFAPLCAYVRPGEAVLLIPPRENIVHFVCGTRSVQWRVQHAWYETDPARYRPVLDEPGLAGVFLFAKSYGDYERHFLEAGDWAKFPAELGRRGYREAFTFDLGTLYRRGNAETGRADEQARR